VSKLLSAALVLFFLVHPKFAHPQGPPDVLKCEDAKVLFSPFDEAYSKRIILKDLSNSENPPSNAQREYSPERDMWKVIIEPDTSKPGPWNTVIYFGSDANETVWKLTLVDVRATSVQWLNEKLVFGKVWWGRIYATDFILDVQQRKFLYREMANYVAKGEPCQ
jgi:hypothetical protein